MLQHIDAAGGGDGYGPTRHAFADDGGDERRLDRETRFYRAGNSFRLAAFFRTDAGIGADSVGERQDRQSETIGQFENSYRLAITFRHRRTEIMLHAALGIAALFLADKSNGPSAEPGQAGNDRLVFTKRPVAGQGREIFQDAIGVIEKMRTAGMARHLHLLPRRQPGIGVRDHGPGAHLQPFHLAIDIHAGIFFGKLAQLDNLAFQLGYGAFKFEVMHGSNHCQRAESDTGIPEKKCLKKLNDPMG